MSLSQIVAEKNQFEKLYYLNSACSSTARESERDRAPLAFLQRHSPFSSATRLSPAFSFSFSLSHDNKSKNYPIVLKFGTEIDFLYLRTEFVAPKNRFISNEDI